MLQTCNADGVIGLQMFMFGTTALEQFMDRVIEWPQYCNHILQISHLRGTHFEMVSAIERALAKISSSQNEPNVGNLLSAEQHVSGSSSMEGIEVTLYIDLRKENTFWWQALNLN